MKLATIPQTNGNKSPEFSERSPIVQSANWKESMLLQKKLQVLNRSEHSLVHGITIDQKVLFRRFQLKLHRSKLAMAEMRRDQDSLRQLRALQLHGLNTNCGQNEDDYEFLAKLEYRPCPVDKISKPKLSAKIKKSQGKEMPLKRSSAFDAHAGSAENKGDKCRATSARVNALVTTLKTRPATAAGTNIENEFHILKTVLGDTTADKIHAFVKNIASEYKIEKSPQKETMLLPQVKAIPQTAPSVLPTQVESPRFRTKGKAGKPSPRASLFEEEKKENFTNILLEQVKMVNYVPQMQELYSAMEEYETGFPAGEYDYYVQKMQSEVAHVTKAKPEWNPAEQEQTDDNLLESNKVKSLTMPKLQI